MVESANHSCFAYPRGAISILIQASNTHHIILSLKTHIVDVDEMQEVGLTAIASELISPPRVEVQNKFPNIPIPFVYSR